MSAPTKPIPLGRVRYAKFCVCGRRVSGALLIDLFPKPCPECGSTCRCWRPVPWTLVERFRAWRAMREFRRLRREACRKIEETDGR